MNTQDLKLIVAWSVILHQRHPGISLEELTEWVITEMKWFGNDIEKIK